METAGLYYEEHGHREAEPLILVSGLGGSASYWAPNIAALADRYRVIAFDQRGTGRSERTVPETPMIEAIADDIGQLIESLGIKRATIIGHAIGGMAGITLALDNPECIARLVVINGWGRIDPYTARCFDARLAILRGAGPREYIYAQPIFLYPPQWTSDHHIELEEEEDRLVAGFPDVELVASRIRDASRFDVIDEVGNLSVPVLFVASDDDALVPPACSERLNAAVPGSKIARIARGGHACNVTDPVTFNHLVLDFLGS